MSVMMTKAKNLEALIREAQEDLVDSFEKLNRRTYEELNTRLELAQAALTNYQNKALSAAEPRHFAEELAKHKWEALAKASDEKAREYLEKSFATQEKNYNNKFSNIQTSKLLDAKQKYLDFANITRNTFANLISAVEMGARVLRIPGSACLDGQMPDEVEDIKATSLSMLTLMIYVEQKTPKDIIAEVDSRLADIGYTTHIKAYEIKKEIFCRGKEKNNIIAAGQAEFSKLQNDKSISEALTQKPDPYTSMYG